MSIAFCRVVGVASNSFLNVRSGPGNNYPVIGTLRNGEAVTVFVLSSTREWDSITAQSTGLRGYVSSQYIGSCSVG